MDSQTLDLRLKDDGSIVVVESVTSTQEVPLDEEEINRQIIQHSNVLKELEKKKAAIVAFRASEANEGTVSVPTSVQNSVVVQSVVDAVVAENEQIAADREVAQRESEKPAEEIPADTVTVAAPIIPTEVEPSPEVNQPIA